MLGLFASSLCLCLCVCRPHCSLCARSISPWLLSLGVCSCRVHPCAPRAHLAVMVTPRTHCHFTMQARAPRVPELCDDHIPPSRLVTNSLAEPRYRSVNTLVLPDPLLTQGGPVTFLPCALHLLYVRSCDLAHRGLYCSHVCARKHHSSWNHSYYMGNSLSALHSLQQLHAGTSSLSFVQMSVSTRESHDAAPSSSVSYPQVTLSATHPQVQMDPTRTITNGLLSAALAEATTQLSFAAFLERCISVSASPPPPLPISTPPLNAATQTIPHIAASRDVSTQHSFREFLAPPSTLHLLLLTFAALRVLDQSPRYFLMRLCRRLYTASQLTMPPHNYRSRSSSSGVSSPTTL